MPIFDDPGKAMRNIEQELLDEQARETAESGEEGANYAVDFDRTAYADEETDEACFVEDTGKKPKGKGAGTVLLALVELAVLAAAIWWWIRWRS